MIYRALQSNRSNTPSNVQNLSYEDSNSTRLSICSGATLGSSVSSPSPISPNRPPSKENRFDSTLLQDRERVQNTMFTPIERSTTTPHRRRRTALLLDQPSKVIGNHKI